MNLLQHRQLRERRKLRRHIGETRAEAVQQPGKLVQLRDA